MINAVSEQFSKFVEFAEQFEASFYAEQLNAPTVFGKNPPTGPSFVVNYFKSNPGALGVFEKTFDASHKKMRQTMSFVCGMADADLGPNGMPEFTIDDIKQEMV